MTLYDQFKNDGELEVHQGIDLDYGGGAVITIRRAGGLNKAYGAVFAAKLRPYERQIQTGSMDEATASRLLAEVYAEAVVLDWRGVTDAAGEALAFTRENVVKVLFDLPELFRDLQEQAGKLANFRRAAVEEAAKNSAPPSPGN